ncbi:MAG: hypothetical protein KDI63_10490 [Gammaproteobacteria bacterium]|nr:hypothetical protein [Gammaproteobacteria bacterium]
MELPPQDLGWFADNLADVIQEIATARSSRDGVILQTEAPAELLDKIVPALVDALKTVNIDNNNNISELHNIPSRSINVSELCDYGLGILGELAQLATDLKQRDQVERIEQLAVSLTLWTLQRQGSLRSIELVVNGLARLANHTAEHSSLVYLFHVMSDVMLALSRSSVGTGPEKSTGISTDARKILLLNRAIVATRALSPDLMDIAFADVANELPESAPQFFAEGMQQIDIQNYPPEVSRVIERFHRDWPETRVFH